MGPSSSQVYDSRPALLSFGRVQVRVYPVPVVPRLLVLTSLFFGLLCGPHAHAQSKSNAIECGLGFTSMRERVRIVGGTMEIRSQPKRGTVIKVSIPLVIKASEVAMN